MLLTIKKLTLRPDFGAFGTGIETAFFGIKKELCL